MSSSQSRPLNSPIQSLYSPKSRLQIQFEGQGLTHQSFKDECDINTIMGRYLKTGVLPENLTQAEAQYLDVSDVDFQAAAELVAGAKSLFEQMPSSIRNRFDNDPAKLLAFTSDVKNRQEAAQMGLLSAEATAAILNPTPASSTPQNAANPVEPPKA